MTQLSRRAFARTRNLSEAFVRKRIASGLLTDAVDPATGLLDADLADKLLAGTIVKPKAGRKPAGLSAAQQRRLRAVAHDLLDEVAVLKGSLINLNDAKALIAKDNAVAAEVYRRLPARMAPTVAGLPASEVQRLLKLGVNQILGETNEAPPRALVQVKEAPPRALVQVKEAPPRALDLDRMSPAELAALVENLRAELLELGRWERIGVPRVTAVNDLYVEALVVSKSLLLALPGRVAQQVEHSTAAEAERLLVVEVEGAVAALVPNWHSLEPRAAGLS